MRVAKFGNDTVDATAALTNGYELFLQWDRQFSVACRSNEHSIELLWQAVARYEWSKKPLSRIETNRFSELEIAVKLN